MVFNSGLDQSQKQRVEEEEEDEEYHLLWLLICNTGDDSEIIIRDKNIKT